MKMGIIAEEYNDVAVIQIFTLFLLKPHRIGFKYCVGHGCGKLRRKCHAWAVNLVRRGCSWIVVIHDLDKYDECELRNELTIAIRQVTARAKIVLIPKHEIEAWLLYDATAIASAFNENKLPRLPGDPESLPRPKEYLRNLIWRKYKKDYLSTIHNELIAKYTTISFVRRASSFQPHTTFVNQIRNELDSAN